MEEIKCNKCGELKTKENYGVDNTRKCGLKSTCKLCTNRDRKSYRKRSNNAATFKYEKTPKGYLVRTYRNMLSRITGVLKEKSHLYAGLPILDKESFYVWALSNEDFLNLYSNWVEQGYCRKLSPSIDRIDTMKGYVMGNIRWLTHSDNSKLGSLSKNRNK